MEQEKKQGIALMRYGAIAPLTSRRIPLLRDCVRRSAFSPSRGTSVGSVRSVWNGRSFWKLSGASLPTAWFPSDGSPMKQRRVTLRYSPDMTDIFVVEQDSFLTPLRTLNKKENADVKRGKLYLSEGES